MARLREGEREYTQDSIYRLIRRSAQGLREEDVARLTGMERRRVNNYLRSLQSEEKIYKDGRSWFAD